MKWLKYKIKNWLREEVFKEELGSIKSMKLQCKNTLNEVNEMKSLYQQITNIGVDVDCHDKNSWAVVLIPLWISLGIFVIFLIFVIIAVTGHYKWKR